MIFDEMINRILGFEGDYSNDKKDPGNWTGGEIGKGVLNGTKFGISAASYPRLNIKNLTRERAIEIYRTDFWDKLKIVNLPDSVAFQLLDFVINSGGTQAIRCLQRVIEVEDDGIWGPVSQARATHVSATDMVLGLIAERLEFLTRLQNWSSAGKGWARRIAQNLRYGLLDT